MGALNYKHLHYFWVLAKTGIITSAAVLSLPMQEEWY